MLNRAANFSVRVVERWMPDPFIFCVLLTLLCFLLALGFTPTHAPELVSQWYGGLWQILPFAMQMILILLAGYTLADSTPVRRLLLAVASLPRTQAGAIALITVASTLLALLNWGVALVASALLAREVARRVPKCDFGFLVAGAYSGYALFGSGLSSSIYLAVSTEGSPLNFLARYAGRPVTPFAETLLSPINLALIASSLIFLPLMFCWMAPRGDQVRPADPDLLEEPAPPEEAPAATPAQHLERSRIVQWLLVLLGGSYLAGHFVRNGFALDFNVVILSLLVSGLALHGRPATYLRAFYRAGHLSGPLVLQYPLYGGIMGIMQQSGLAEVVSRWFVSISGPKTFFVYTYISASLINFFIPSAGGQWAVQGPVTVNAALELGVSPLSATLALTFGDMISNMLQPFWALPILAIAGLKVRDIMGYCVLTFLLLSALSCAILLFLA